MKRNIGGISALYFFLLSFCPRLFVSAFLSSDVYMCPFLLFLYPFVFVLRYTRPKRRFTRVVLSYQITFQEKRVESLKFKNGMYLSLRINNTSNVYLKFSFTLPPLKKFPKIVNFFSYWSYVILKYENR